MALRGIMFRGGNTSIFLVRKTIDNEHFVKSMTVQFAVFLGNHAYVAKREVIYFIIMQACPV